jgi:predicted nuclease of predicted toxin-antitoxin system
MSRLRLVADVHISPLTVKSLKSQGYDIARSTDFLPVNAADIEILEFARVEDRIVLTQDLDFSMLVALSNYELPRSLAKDFSVAGAQLSFELDSPLRNLHGRLSCVGKLNHPTPRTHTFRGAVQSGEIIDQHGWSADNPGGGRDRNTGHGG